MARQVRACCMGQRRTSLRVETMTKFRPCIDLHNGQVKQIVGGTLDVDEAGPVENFVSDRGADWYAQKYAEDALTGGHVIKLGPGNEEAAKAALAAYPGGLQIGGGITAQNAAHWLEAGASHVIVTSWLFSAEGKFLWDRLEQLKAEVGREKLVLDLSCRSKEEGGWTVAMDRWQTLTDLDVTGGVLDEFAGACDEFLIHAADVEGLCGGIDQELVRVMGEWGKIPMTYAGGVATMKDVELVERLSGGKVDVTVGSALDIFGGEGVGYEELVGWNSRSAGVSPV